VGFLKHTQEMPMKRVSTLVIATDVVQAPNDKQQIAPMLEKLDALPEQLGRPETLLADNGYFSEANVMACTAFLFAFTLYKSPY
jgi:hypothetical protein